MLGKGFLLFLGSIQSIWQHSAVRHRQRSV